MSLKILSKDITKIEAGAVVNVFTTPLLINKESYHSIIEKADFKEILDNYNKLENLTVGQSFITNGYKLCANHIIHTMVPVWQGGEHNELELLYKSYDGLLKLALANNITSIAIPLNLPKEIGYPKNRVLRILTLVIEEFLLKHDMVISLVINENDSILLSDKQYNNIENYIAKNYIEKEINYSKLIRSEKSLNQNVYLDTDASMTDFKKRSLDDVISNKEETFSEMLIRLIDQKGVSDVETYKNANIDRRLFSKIRSDKDYKPSKATAIAFSISLNLNIDETYDLLQRAGYALSPSSKFDIIIEFFIEHENYNIFEINEALFSFDQNLLGG